ncbi:hypothetical protein FTUN_7192 [Frigoriglobus tundricola]|uniref:Uncharacterized protein n=1 Tax=Frigoriglobus tundricola TaxID=2774151 RepID=A0A6M5Z1T2_9BACT|nr:hypothetical protein FTUN_7192 [Frigoriglobus tundricola]
MCRVGSGAPPTLLWYLLRLSGERRVLRVFWRGRVRAPEYSTPPVEQIRNRRVRDIRGSRLCRACPPNSRGRRTGRLNIGIQDCDRIEAAGSDSRFTSTRPYFQLCGGVKFRIIRPP